MHQGLIRVTEWTFLESGFCHLFRLTLCGKASRILLITNETVLSLNLETTFDHISSPLNDGSRNTDPCTTQDFR